MAIVSEPKAVLKRVRTSYSLPIIERIKTLDKDCSRAEIAKELGITRKALNIKMSRLGIKKSCTAQRVIALFNQGLSINAISVEVQRSYHTVYWHLNTRNFSGLNREHENGKHAELLAKKYLINSGWKILDQGNIKTYDLLVRKGTQVYAVNVKSGRRNFIETFKNFTKLVSLPYPAALLYVTPENPPSFYWLPIQKMES